MEDIPLGSAASQQRPRAAVTITGATKSYDGKHAVLRGLDMTVPKGQIYGLLGPSGCGKTTLLNIIVGQYELDSGFIEVEASNREDIGYMPQDLNLHLHLTILQTFKFYGRMLNMDSDAIIKRAKELEVLLDLPPNHRMIESLSGGQMRRVSLGVALLHNPNILLLDEPTVGIDPILSKSIWNHLVSFSNGGKTIIITTHYIEEARQAHTIGLMRDGILLAEESPEILISRCNVSTLEEVFLILSQKQEVTSDAQTSAISNESKSNISKKKVNFNDDVFHKNRMYSLLLKNIWFFFQQKSFTALIILMPLSTTFFVNETIGLDPKGLNIAVVNNEIQERRLRDCKPEYYDGCFFNNTQDILLSCAYVEQIKSKSLNILYYDEVDIALKSVRQNKAWGLLYFPNNYTRSLSARFMEGSNTQDADIDSSTVQIWIDYSNYIIGNKLNSNFYVGMQEFLGNELNKCNVSKRIGNIPMTFNKPVFGSENALFIHSSSASILCLNCFLMPALFTLGVMITEKSGGMMERMMASGIQFSEIIVSTIIVQFVTHIIQTAAAMLVNFVYFDNPYLGDHWSTITLLILLGMEGMIYGFLLVAMCNTFTVAANLGAMINMGFFFTCGLIWPLESAHFLIKLIGPISPMTAPIKAFQALANK